jgi:dihydroflavonol-4-reductase
MQYYTQMPPADDTPGERDLGITQRESALTLADTVDGLQRVGRI